MGLVTDRKPFRGCWPETDEEWIDLAPCDSDGPHQRRAGVAQLRLATVLPREMIRREAAELSHGATAGGADGVKTP